VKKESFEKKSKTLLTIIQLYEKEASLLGSKVLPIKDHLRKAKKHAKKFDMRKMQVERKFDSLLGTFIAASGLNVDLGAAPGLSGGQAFKYDSNLHKMLYSRDALKDMKKRIREEGFLPVMLEQIVWIARTQAMKKSVRLHGRYEANNEDWIKAISQGLVNLCRWLAESQDAPNRLIKRTVPKIKRKRKVRAAVSEPEEIRIAHIEDEAATQTLSDGKD
jgi:hypothetical protein